MARAPRRRPRSNVIEHRMARAIDQLAEFEEFTQQVLPALRNDIQKGLSADEIYKKYTSLAAARNITIALTDQDSGKALTAIKDILDRTAGKPTERKEVKHTLEDASEEEIDAMLLSKLSKLDDEEDTSRH